MSVSYEMTYTVYLNGAPDLLAQIPAVAREVAEEYIAHAETVFWDQSPAYRETAQLFCDAAEQALEAGETVCRLEQEEGDDRHGVMDAFLTALDTRLPQLALAILAVYLDAEYTHSRLSNFLYSPAGSSSLHLKDFYGYESRRDALPNESWIPYSWRHFTPSGRPSLRPCTWQHHPAGLLGRREGDGGAGPHQRRATGVAPRLPLYKRDRRSH